MEPARHNFHNCPPWVGPFGGVQMECFEPEQVREAESRLPFAPVDPLELVQDATGLPLTLVVLRTAGGLRAADEPAPPFTHIEYYFGDAEISRHTPAPRTPKFVVIGEALWDDVPLPGKPAIDRAVGWTGQVGVEPRNWHGPWDMHAGFRQGRLALHVRSNLPRRAVERLGRDILRRDAGATA